jgi:hypothetical protein
MRFLGAAKLFRDKQGRVAADLAADRDENSAKRWLGVETSSALRAEERDESGGGE